MYAEQGDLVEVNFNPTVDHEPQRHRPALVVSVGHFNNVVTSLTVACPITSTNNGYPLHIRLPEGCPVRGRVRIEQMRAVDLNDPAWSATSLGEHLNAATISLVLDAIGAVFGI